MDMKRPFKCLYLEHVSADFMCNWNWISRALAEVVDPQCDRAITELEAVDKLKASHGEIDLFLMDWIMDHALGKEAKERARAVNALEAAKAYGIPTIGLSGFQQDTEEYVTFREVGGGDALFSKWEVRNWLPRDWLAKIEGVLQKHGRSLFALTMEGCGSDAWWHRTRADLELAAEVEEIGKENILHLVRLLVVPAAYTTFHPGFVARGHSGAHVISARFAAESTAVGRTLLVKVARDRRKLQKELDGARDARAPASPEIYVQYLEHGEPKEYGGWHAIGSWFYERATTLHDWLVRGRASSERVSSVLTNLLMNLKTQEYELGERKDRLSLLDFPSIEFKTSRRALVLASIEDLAVPLARFQVIPRPDPIANFIKYSQLVGRNPNSVPAGVYTCWSHGDLHARNILVKDDDRLWLIDTARRDQRQWASDPARLCVDLMLNTWDQAESHFWFRGDGATASNLTLWRDVLRDWFDGVDLPFEGFGPSGPAAALNCIRDSLREVFGEHFIAWQFELAILIELLLHSTYETIPAPRRCLALGLADSLICRLATAIPNSGDTVSLAQ